MANLIGKLKKLKIKQQQKILLQLCIPVSQKLYILFSNHLLQSIIDLYFPFFFISFDFFVSPAWKKIA